MNKSLSGMLHEAFQGERSGSLLTRDRIAAVLSQEADRQCLSGLRRLWLSGIPLCLLCAWLNDQPGYALGDRLGPLALAVFFAATGLLWRALPASTRMLPLSRRFQLAAALKAASAVIMLGPLGLLLLLYPLVKAGILPGSFAAYWIGLPPLLGIPLVLGGLALGGGLVGLGAFRLVKYGARRLDPYWFE